MERDDIMNPDFSSSDESDAQTVARLTVPVESKPLQLLEAASEMSAADAEAQRTVQTLRLSLLATQEATSRDDSDSDAESMATVALDSNDERDSVSSKYAVGQSSAVIFVARLRNEDEASFKYTPETQTQNVEAKP